MNKFDFLTLIWKLYDNNSKRDKMWKNCGRKHLSLIIINHLRRQLNALGSMSLISMVAPFLCAKGPYIMAPSTGLQAARTLRWAVSRHVWPSGGPTSNSTSEPRSCWKRLWKQSLSARGSHSLIPFSHRSDSETQQNNPSFIYLECL